MNPRAELQALFAHGISQQQIANATGITQAGISKINSGINKNISLDSAEKIHCVYLAHKHGILPVMVNG